MIFSHTTWDYTWLNPPAYQKAAFTIAQAHPGKLPPQEIALAIATAPTSEWLRAVRWFHTNANSLPDWDPDIIAPLIRVCGLLIELVESDYGIDDLDESDQQPLWWPNFDYFKLEELATLWQECQPLLPFVQQYFSRFTLTGIEIILNCLDALNTKEQELPIEPTPEQKALEHQRRQLIYETHRKRKQDELDALFSEDVPF